MDEEVVFLVLTSALAFGVTLWLISCVHAMDAAVAPPLHVRLVKSSHFVIVNKRIFVCEKDITIDGSKIYVDGMLIT